MTPKQLAEAHSEVCYRLRNLTTDKNADYSGQHSNAFNNFIQIENFPVGVTAEQAFFVRMSDKMARLASFIGGKDFLVKSESVKDTLDDLANYAILLNCYLKHKQIEELNASIMEKQVSSLEKECCTDNGCACS